MGTGVTSSSGFTGTVNYAEFAALANRDAFTGTDGAATAGDGTREVEVASGAARVHNTLHTLAGASLNLAENTSGQTRVDLICLHVDWTADSGAGDASLVAVTGTPSASPSAPYGSLSATPGTAWHEPIAEVTVASGAGVLGANTVQDVRQGPRIAGTLASPWVAYQPGAWATPSYRKLATGAVMLSGLVKNGTASYPGSTVLTLPQPFRPHSNLHWWGGWWTSSQGEVPAWVQVFTDGVVKARSTTGTAGAAVFLSIECNFSTI